MTEVLLTVGTRKGLFIGRRRGGGAWEFDEGPYFNSQAVYSVAIDTRGDVPRLLAGGDSAHFGPSVFHSDDLGRTWTEPSHPAVKFPKDTGASLERVWQLHPAAAERDVVYAGTERRRSTARRTGARRSTWCVRCGSTRRGRSGSPAAVARACTRWSPIRVTLAR